MLVTTLEKRIGKLEVTMRTNIPHNHFKKQHKQNDLIRFIDSQSLELIDLTYQLVKHYGELLEKDTLTPNEEWELRWIQKTIPKLRNLSNSLFSLLLAYRHVLPKEKTSPLFERLIDLQNFFKAFYEEEPTEVEK